MATKKYAIHMLKWDLMRLGWSFNSWAKEHGFKPVTVRQTIRRYWGQKKKPKFGEQTTQILQQLEKTIRTKKEKATHESDCTV